MRVAHILRKYDPAEWGGTETAIERLTVGFAGQDVESIVFAPRLTKAPAAVADPLAAAGCAVRRYRAFVSVWGISAERKRQMVAVGGNVISFDLIRSLWREPGLDLIHSHALGRLGAIGRAVARKRRLPFVLSVHGGAYDLPAGVRQEMQRVAAEGWDWGQPLGWLLRARHLFADSDAIITVNQREAELIRERHPDRRVLVQPHGVPAALFAQDHRLAARAAFPAVQGRMVLLVPGRIDPIKNQDWLVAQAAKLVRRHPQLLLVLVGACTHREYGDELQARITREGLQASVLLAGKLPPGDPRLIGLFQEAQAVVLPSLSETFGLVILEAWAAGTPVISSRTSGATALVKDGVNGLLFDLERPGSFHVAVDRLLSQPERRIEWGAAGRAKVVADYDTAALAGRMKRIYEELIEEKKMHTVILRDDDTSAVTPRACLERLYRPFLDRGLPVNLAVIPEVRTDVRTPDGRLEGFLSAGGGAVGPLAPMAGNRELADYLRGEAGYHIVQHGCHHDYFEFGISDRAELARRLDHGASCLRDAGFERSEAFVAPYDRLSRAAFVEVAARFEVISTGWFEVGRVPLRWWPAYALKKLQRQAHWRVGGTAFLSHPGCLLSYHRPYAGMFASVRRAIEGRALTVLVTHWWEYFRDGVPDEEFIGVLHEVAGWLASRSDIRVVSFRDVANGQMPLSE